MLGASFALTPKLLGMAPPCTFREATGLPCPGCGLTRAFCAISRGDWGEAVALNPLAFPFYAGGVLILLWPLLTRSRPGLSEKLWRSRWLVVVPVVLVAAMWIFGILRLL